MTGIPADRERFVGMVLPTHIAAAEVGRLRFFARVIGESDPAYSDEAAARAAGHPSLPVPPTFLFCLDMALPEPYAYLQEMGVDLGRVLHGEQSFRYHRLAYAGEPLAFHPRISDIYTRKGKALELIVRETAVRDGEDRPVAELRSVIVVRRGP